MAQASTMAVELRDRAGKGAARLTRRNGRVPAVIYGNKQDPVMISLDPVELMLQLKGGGFFSRVFEFDINGEKQRVLPRDLQQHPVSDRPIHVDFMRFSAKTRLNIEVNVIFENEEECPGLKGGGVLNIVRHTVELRCSPDHVPESLNVDLTGLEVGDSVHISSIKLPGDVELTITDRDFTIATIAAPTVNVEVEEVEVEEGEEGAEGEATEGDAKEGDAKDDASKD
ncbi:MAG: 50S ribosomal protein L25/general stress protein Ctc [Rhodospirillaceae bacterium]|nr:50S ribosomal protein L25/general stress protein Ctc [Rhodospirillaceae bacterium]